MTAAIENELVLDRLLDAPRDRVWRCWTEPELLTRWFVPEPWSVAAVEIDLRPGGACNLTMRDPDGNDHPNTGVYLEIVAQEKLVFSDCFAAGWAPRKPFFVAVITFADEGGKTRYIARARHWTAEDCENHDKMGFHEGWGQCADQLEKLAGSL